ncbi:MAG TPA: ATP synthase F1 subunit delta [Candidatus Moranbacteria bacterium]|nr:ATP synthase F1 subunit delta [Candidatus Moranbacteria bacterium]
MKISSKQCAQTLFELTLGKSENEIDSVILKFVKLLKKNKQLKKTNDIIKKFNEIYNKANGIIEAEIVTIRELGSEQFSKIESFLKEKYSVKKVILKSKIDKNIKGGIIIKVGDEVLDGSIKGRLNELARILKS